MEDKDLPVWQRGDSVAKVKPKVKAAAAPASNWGKAKAVTILGATALICGLILGVVGMVTSKHDSTPAAAPASTTSTSLTTVAAVAADCPDSKPVSFTEHPESKARAEGITGGNSEIIEVVRKDPQWVAYALPAIFPDQYGQDPPDWHTLVTADGKCFNQRGLVAQAQVLGALTSGGTTHEDNVAIPTNLVNTGIGTSGAPVTNASAGMPNGRVGTRYVFANGSDIYVDYYCGNIPHKSVPKFTITRIPPGPTTVVSTPPVITTQPPGCVGPCQPIVCPPGTIGVPPNCVIPECPPGTIGTPPNCVIPQCPPGTIGTPPHCVIPECPPGQHGTPPVCKDDVSNGPGPVVDVPQRPNPLPVLPSHEEPSAPVVPSPTVQYTPPSSVPAKPAPVDQGGPTAISTPRSTPTRETEAPAPQTPETRNICPPGMSSC